MPYIDRDRRPYLEVLGVQPDTPGELNFVISDIIKTYWDEHSNYQGINDIVGALEGAKAEFQRRIVGPYEDLKIEQNGDVY